MNSYSPYSFSSTPNRSPGRILVVDDEPHVLAVAKAILEAHGFDVMTSNSGEQALAACQDAITAGQRYSVIVLDLTMPGGISGFEVLELLLGLDSSLSVIACSGYFEEDSREMCRSIGFADVLHKPYTLDLLCSTVRRCLTRTHQNHTSSGASPYEEVNP